MPSFTTTAIYANAVGEEEQSIAARMWVSGRDKRVPFCPIRTVK